MANIGLRTFLYALWARMKIHERTRKASRGNQL